MIVTNELYTLNGNSILKDGHSMFKKDIVKDLNAWRNEARSFRNKNAMLLKEIGKLKYPKPTLSTEINEEDKKNGD